MNNTSPLIGFDAKRIVRNGTGLGSYGRTLVGDLSHHHPQFHYRLYAPDAGRDDLRSAVESLSGVTMVYPRRVLPLVGKALWRTWGIIDELKRDGVQLFHGLSGELPMGLRKSGIPGIVTIHDLIFMRHPEYYRAIDRQIYEWKFRQALRQTSHVIAISQRTKQDILELSDFPEERISVIYQSCAPRFSPVVDADAQQRVSHTYHLPARYILNVGTIEPRKNILLAVKALKQLPKDICLVVVGRSTNYAQMVRTYADAHGLAQRLLMLHGVPDSDLPALYAQAEAFVYPSRYEGFGIPVIEAIRQGLPVVACSGSCLEEAGGPDSLYVDADDVDACADAIRQSLKGSTNRDGRIARSQAYVRRFEGSDVTAQVCRLYQQYL